MRIYLLLSLLLTATSLLAEEPTQETFPPKETAIPSTETSAPPPTSDSKQQILNTLNKMSPKEIAELMHFITNMGERFNAEIDETADETAPSTEKISRTIKQMTASEVAELMNFITAMEEDVSDPSSAVEEPSQTVPSAVTNTLKKLINAPLEKIVVTKTPIAGLFEATIDAEILYISEDGRYILMGDLRDAQNGDNLTENKRNQQRVAILNSVDEKDMVVFAPTTETKAVLNVFTDVDCPYCSKFHNEVKDLNAAGIKVRYLAFPRAGQKSPTFKKMVSVWCAKDQQQAMTDAKAGKEIPEATCSNPVQAQFELGSKIGVNGTPALVLSTGELIPGYVPAAKLVPHLLQEKSPSPFRRR